MSYQVKRPSCSPSSRPRWEDTCCKIATVEHGCLILKKDIGQGPLRIFAPGEWLQVRWGFR